MDNKDNENVQDDKELMQNVEVDPETGKAVDAEDCDCNEETEKIVSERVVNLSEAVETIFSGEEDLSEDFKTKVQTILETVVKTMVDAEIENIEEEAREAINLKVSMVEDELNEKVDTYLKEHVIPQWMEENKVALEQGVKYTIAESFVSDLKNLLESYDIYMTDEKADALDEAAVEIDDLKSEVNELIDTLAEKEKEIFDLKKEKIMSKLSEGLAMTQIEKFNSLVEEITTTDLEVFEKKAKIVRDSVFETVKHEAPKGEKVQLDEEESDPYMERLLATLKQNNKKD